MGFACRAKGLNGLDARGWSPTDRTLPRGLTYAVGVKGRVKTTLEVVGNEGEGCLRLEYTFHEVEVDEENPDAWSKAFERRVHDALYRALRPEPANLWERLKAGVQRRLQ